MTSLQVYPVNEKACRLMKALIRNCLAAIAVCLVTVTISATTTAQPSPSDYTSAVRYDVMGRIVGTIAPDPDGTGPLKFAAARSTYDLRGNVTKVETGELANWQSEAVLPSSWTDFTIHNTAETTYDVMGRKLTDTVKGDDGVAIGLTQYSYDAVGRLECTAVRMNPAAYNALPADACTLGTQGSEGPDRIPRRSTMQQDRFCKSARRLAPL